MSLDRVSGVKAIEVEPDGMHAVCKIQYPDRSIGNVRVPTKKSVDLFLAQIEKLKLHEPVSMIFHFKKDEKLYEVAKSMVGSARKMNRVVGTKFNGINIVVRPHDTLQTFFDRYCLNYPKKKEYIFRRIIKYFRKRFG